MTHSTITIVARATIFTEIDDHKVNIVCTKFHADQGSTSGDMMHNVLVFFISSYLKKKKNNTVNDKDFLFINQYLQYF